MGDNRVMVTRESVRCSRCDAELSEKDRFCPDCGTPVKAPGAVVTLGPRYAAFLVDVTAILGLWFLSSFVVRPLVRLVGAPEPELSVNNFTGVLSAVMAIVLIPLIAFLFHAFYFRRGDSPGMRVVGIKVVTTDGKRPGWGKAILRSFVFWGPLLTMMLAQGIGGLGGPRGLATSLGGLGAASIAIIWVWAVAGALSRSRRGLHDRLSGTQLVRS